MNFSLEKNFCDVHTFMTSIAQVFVLSSFKEYAFQNQGRL